MYIRLIGMRLLFCCGDHDKQFGELIVANKSGITVKFTDTNKMAWQWAETLVEIRGTLADVRGTT